MPKDSEALQRIEDDFEELKAAIDRCRNVQYYSALDWKSAYSALARLRERYLRERASLTKTECGALSKVFEKDRFIEGMMAIRVVGDHIEQ